MKCGLELLAIANEAKIQREIKEKKKNEQVHTDFITRKINTVKWCDTVLSDYLEKMVSIDPSFMHGGWTYYKNDLIFESLDGYNGKTIRFREHIDYNALRWFINEFINDKKYSTLDTDTIIEYCNQHCIEVKTCHCHLKHNYGADSPHRVILSFRISPDCFN